MRLAVYDRAVETEEIRMLVGLLAESEWVTVVAQAVLPDAQRVLAELSRGSQVLKAPRGLLIVQHYRKTPALNSQLFTRLNEPSRVLCTLGYV